MNDNHYVEKCKHGLVVRQCRCIGPKTLKIVACVSKKCSIKLNPVAVDHNCVDDCHFDGCALCGGYHCDVKICEDLH